MSSKAPHQHLYWGAARQVASVDPLECGREGTVLWERPDAGESYAGLGEAVVLSGMPSEVLNAVEARPVQWLTEMPDVPGPWFGGVAFDPERPRSECWSGFGAARFILPEIGVARCAGRSWALAFVEAENEGEAECLVVLGGQAVELLVDDVESAGRNDQCQAIHLLLDGSGVAEQAEDGDKRGQGRE